MKSINFKLLFKIGIFLVLFFFNFALAEDLTSFCPEFVKNIDQNCQNLGIQQCRIKLEECEKFYEDQGQKYQEQINELSKAKKNLKNEIKLLETKIKNLNFEIQKNSLIIKNLNFQISDTQKSIDETNEKIASIKENLSNILKLQYEEDQKNIIEIFFAGDSLASVFDKMMTLNSLSLKTKDLLKNIKDLKAQLEEQMDKMSQEKGNLENIVLTRTVQKEESEKLQEQKTTLFKKTKGEEELYQAYLQETKKKAQEIRKKIFELAQVPEGQKITLEQAYLLAKEVEKITGVRAALILGLLKVESDIGNNVGQCNCDNCNFPNISWKQVMPQRHWYYFEQICKELGYNPDETPVSCAINGGKIQWGGAIGPAQFMPETWVALGYKSRVEQILRVNPANPWRVKDAFLAAGLYLSDFGADNKSLSQELAAARAYLCGTTKLTISCRIAGGSSYASSVIKYASYFQDLIDQGTFD
ncbi:MAG: lytic murein transglycosylase [Minisyncoccia bacterium]